ncbi:hypothetical protein [Kocuria rosea]|uniref:Uncharacterized protein n=1 Tax=Kocuria rosea TaxID=1275 RepID=A0A4R5Y2A5_KOCRO|nr:hypothetical protein [Kocuria rosea]TDL38561.1 hypothetical protein E2R59_16775 [Kocuria rosea]
MVPLPGAVLLYGCFVVAGAGATALWSLVQVALDLAPAARRRSRGARASARRHLGRATSATAVALLTAGAPSLLRHLEWLAVLARTS